MADRGYQADPPEEDRPRRAAPRRRRYDEDEDVPDVRRRGGDGGVDNIIPYRNPMALIGYYLSVFSLIPCLGALLGPAAVVLGILALGYRNKYPTAKGLAHAIVALVLGGLTTLGHLGVAVAMFVGMSLK